MTTYSHEFEDEHGNETELTDITYVVLATYVQPSPEVENEIVFTHIVKIRPESFDLELAMMRLDQRACTCGDYTTDDPDQVVRRHRNPDKVVIAHYFDGRPCQVAVDEP